LKTDFGGRKLSTSGVATRRIVAYAINDVLKGAPIVKTNARSFIDALYSEKPLLHHGETELSRPIDASETSLSPTQWNAIANRDMCHGIGIDLAEFLFRTVSNGWHTLETGAGLSTLIFVERGAWHVAITPNEEESVRIKRYAAEHNVEISRLTFVPLASENYLPTARYENLDCVLIDGKHAFPWPILDWFFTAPMLRRGGLLILDDIDLWPVKVLADFLASEKPRWTCVQQFDRSICFEKRTESVHDVTWHMQPLLSQEQQRYTIRRITTAIKRRLRSAFSS